MLVHVELATLIRREATLRDLTIADLAALVGMPRATVRAYLRGARALPELAARALLTALHQHGPFRIRETERNPIGFKRTLPARLPPPARVDLPPSRSLGVSRPRP